MESCQPTRRCFCKGKLGEGTERTAGFHFPHAHGREE